MTFTLRSPQKIAQLVPRNVMNIFNEHEIIVEHKNFFAPNRAGLPILFFGHIPFQHSHRFIRTPKYSYDKYFIMLNHKYF